MRVVPTPAPLGAAQRHLAPLKRGTWAEIRARTDSVDIKAKVGDFGFALSPASAAGLLNRKVAGVVRNTSVESKGCWATGTGVPEWSSC